MGQPFDYFSPFSLIFTDAQTRGRNAPDLHLAVQRGGDRDDARRGLSNVEPVFIFDPATGAGEFKTMPVLAGGVPVLDANDWPPSYALTTAGQIGVRVTATDPGGLSVTNTFVINVVPPNSPPLAVDDTYTTFENVALTTLPSTGVLHNDIDPNADPFTATCGDRTGTRDADVQRGRDRSSISPTPTSSERTRSPTRTLTAPAR